MLFCYGATCKILRGQDLRFESTTFEKNLALSCSTGYFSTIRQAGTVHSKFELNQRPGLTNVLVGHSTLEEALQATDVPGLRILASGPLPPNPAELLNSRAMTQLLDTLKDHADMVILDSPPCLAAADAQVLSAKADGVLYVIQFGDVKKSAVRHGSDMLRQAHAHILGVVFNKIELTGQRDDYFYNSYRYYNYYSKGSPQLSEGENRPTTKERRRTRRSTEEFEALLASNNGNNGSKGASQAPGDKDTDAKA